MDNLTNKQHFNTKIQALRDAIKDNQFMDDLIEVSKDFKIVDLEGWNN